MSARDGGVFGMFSKKGGCLMYVDFGSQRYKSPSGTGMDFQCASPSNTLAYSFAYISLVTESRTVDSISCGVGQISRRYTGFPEESEPSDSVVKSISMRPARAYATTSGGDAK